MRQCYNPTEPRSQDCFSTPLLPFLSLPSIFPGLPSPHSTDIEGPSAPHGKEPVHMAIAAFLWTACPVAVIVLHALCPQSSRGPVGLTRSLEQGGQQHQQQARGSDTFCLMSVGRAPACCVPHSGVLSETCFSGVLESCVRGT